MPSTDWRKLEQSIGRDAFKLEGRGGRGGVGVIACVWLAFYVLAVAHSLISQRAAEPLAAAEAQAPALAGASR